MIICVTGLTQMAHAQSNTCDSLLVDHFYLEDTSNVSSHQSFYFECDGKSNLKKLETMFDSLNVITVFKALDIGCSNNFTTYTITLDLNEEFSQPTWVLKGKTNYKMGGSGYGNATGRFKEMTINASTGNIISLRKKKYRTIVHF